MAGHKKKGGRNNNKKKGGSNAGSGARGDTGNQQDSTTLLQNIANLPTFHNDSKTSSAGTIGSGGGHYETYKRSTNNFCNWMKQALPKSKIVAVNDL
jgi:hypothetical protein